MGCICVWGLVEKSWNRGGSCLFLGLLENKTRVPHEVINTEIIEVSVAT